MTQAPLDPESQFIELLAQFDEALATAAETSSVATLPFTSSLEDGNLQRRFDRIQGCLLLLEEDRRRQSASTVNHQTAQKPAAVPRQIGRFRVLRRLGSGGFGVVFLAEDPLLRRQVAIKMPLASIFQSQDLHDRFLRECRAAAMLNHPGIVRVLESGDVQGIPYQVAEFVDGERLSDLLKRERPEVQWSARLVRDLADAVQHAHDHGVLHRDIKPDNILLHTQPAAAERGPFVDSPVDLVVVPASAGHSNSMSAESSLTAGLQTQSRDGWRGAANLEELAAPITKNQLAPVPRITDFGLARLVDEDTALSRSGMLVGTPKYMSPEQLHGKVRVQGPPTDIYALGVVLHELLTGTVPFADAQNLQARIGIAETVVPSFRSGQTGVSRDLETICLKCLQVRPEDRYSSAGDLRDDLSRYLDGRPTLARPVPLYEQFSRWVVRNQKLAGLLGLLIVAMFVVLVQAIRNDYASRQQNKVLSAILSQLTAEKQRADESLTLADRNRVIAEQSEARYRDTAWLAQQGEYSAGMVEASSLWKRGEIALMNKVLRPLLTHSVDGMRSFESRYLWDQGQTLRPLIGHSEYVKDLKFAADGLHAWSIGLDNTVRRWNLKSAVLEATWQLEGEGREHKAAISRDCRRAVISRTMVREQRDDVVVWDLESGRVIMQRSFGSDNVHALAIADGNGVVLVGGRKSSEEKIFTPFLQAWFPDKDQVLEDDSSFRMVGVGEDSVPGNTISAMSLAPDGNGVMIAVVAEPVTAYSQLIQTSLNPVAAAGSDKAASLLGPVTTVRWDRGTVHKLILSPSGRTLAMTLLGPDVSCWAEIWDLERRKLVRATQEFLSPTSCIAFDSTETKLGLGITVLANEPKDGAAPANENVVPETRSEFRLWDFVADTTTTLPYSTKRDVVFLMPLSFTDGPDWIVGEGGGALSIWQPEIVSPHHALNGHHPKETWDLAFTGDGSTVFSVGDDHLLRKSDLTARAEKNQADLRSMLVSCVAVSPDGRWVAAGGYDDEVAIYDAQSLSSVATLKGHSHDVRSVAFSPDSQMLATGGRDRTIRIWNVPGFKLSGIRNGHDDTVRALTWTNDGQLISAGSDQRILVWDSSGSIVSERIEPEGVHSIEFAPAGLRLPVHSKNADTSKQSFSLDSRSKVSPDSGEADRQHMITVQADELLALGMKHGTVRLWHLPTDSVIFEAQHHGVEIRSLAFSPDGRTLAVAGSDEAVYLWHVATGRNVLTFDQIGSAVHRVVFSPDGTRLLAALHDGTIRIWHAPH